MKAITEDEIKDCRYCDYSDALSPGDKAIKCYFDIGEHIENPKQAKDCPFFRFDGTFPKI